jgi:predicted Fe-Mo cluster-binding NifX family protein
MKIAFPSQENSGLNSVIHGHFGSAQYFIIVNTDTGELETVRNNDLHHMHGMCQPLAALGKSVDAIVTGGIGAGAFQKLRQAGISVYKGIEGSVSENVELIRNGRLPQVSIQDTCAGHSDHGQCAH